MSEEIAVIDEPKKKLPRGKKRAAQKRLEGLRRDGSVEKFPRERFLKFLGVLRIQSKDYGLIPFQLLGSQIYVLDEICKGIEEGITTFIILKARQLGMSTFLLALDLFWAMEHEGLLGVFCTHEEASRDQFRNQIEVFFQTIPKEFLVPYTTSNRTMLVLENASLFRYLVAGTRGTTNKLGRSGGCNFAHLTEMAFWGSADDLTALQQTFSEIYPNRLYIAESTPNGYNHFEEMWSIAVDSPAQKAIFVGWWRDERNEFSKEHPLFLKYMPEGAASTLKAEEREMVIDVRKQFGVQLTAGQLAWWRHHLETKCNNDLNQMYQEMAHTPEVAFRATGSQFFTNEAVTAMLKEARTKPCLPMAFRVTNQPGDTGVSSTMLSKADLKIWEEPSPIGRYVIGADAAYGSSDDNDCSVLFVGRCYADCIVQVAEFASNTVKPYQFAWIIAYLAGLYRDTMVQLEIGGAGSATFDELNRLRGLSPSIATDDDLSLRNCLRHMKEFLYFRTDSFNGGRMRQWIMSPDLKVKLMERYKTGFETGRIRVRSMISLEEHRKIVRDQGSIAAGGKAHDDRVIAAALAYWSWDTYIQRDMARNGRTMKEELEREEGKNIDPVDSLVAKFMANRGIKIPDEGDEA
jgi:hypothetical protein